MDQDYIFSSAYAGSKTLTQNDIPSANATGFGAASDDYASKGIDLNNELIKNKPSTFFFKVNNEAMAGFEIHIGDILIVDRSLTAKNGYLVIAVVDGELLVRKYFRINNQMHLEYAYKSDRPKVIEAHTQIEIWGVVVHVIRTLVK